MGWFKRQKSAEDIEKSSKNLEGMWLKCNLCRAIIYAKEVERNQKVCPKCDYHFPFSVEERIAHLTDEQSFQEWDADIVPEDALEFVDTMSYSDRLLAAQKKTGKNEAIVSGQCTIDGHVLGIGIFNFRFMGGSMGSVVGEKICRAIDRSLDAKMPFLLITTSGGARMQEGALSLMQMAKTASALARFAEARLPFIVLLTDPTFGGVTASVAMLGDVILAEPKALIGFAGPRVIEQTIKQRLPDGFQRAEFLLEHGMIDRIVSRKNLKFEIHSLLQYVSP